MHPPASSAPDSVRVIYPDMTPGIANPARSIRLDALAPSGANISYTCDGHVVTILVNVAAPVNRGSASFGTHDDVEQVMGLEDRRCTMWLARMAPLRALAARPATRTIVGEQLLLNVALLGSFAALPS